MADGQNGLNPICILLSGNGFYDETRLYTHRLILIVLNIKLGMGKQELHICKYVNVTVTTGFSVRQFLTTRVGVNYRRIVRKGPNLKYSCNGG